MDNHTLVPAQHPLSDWRTAFTHTVSCSSQAGCCFTHDRLPTDTSVWEGPRVSVSISAVTATNSCDQTVIRREDGTRAGGPGTQTGARGLQCDSSNTVELAADTEVSLNNKRGEMNSKPRLSLKFVRALERSETEPVQSR